MNSRPEILLHPNIPKPLHGIAPRVVLGPEWWERERLIAYEKTGFRCAACGVPKRDALFHKWLEAHELYEIDYPKGRMTLKEVVALCHSCHNYIHSGRLEMLAREGKISRGKRALILLHGDSIIEAAGLEKPKPPKKAAAWEEWRLVVEGKEYKGRFDSFVDWVQHYHGIDLSTHSFYKRKIMLDILSRLSYI